MAFTDSTNESLMICSGLQGKFETGGAVRRAARRCKNDSGGGSVVACTISCSLRGPLDHIAARQYA